MDMYEKFESAGFSQNEAKAYVALVSYGEMNLKLIEQKTSLHRANLLTVLERLEKKGAIGIIQEGKRKKYFAISPEILFKRLNTEKEATLKELELTLSGIGKKARTSNISIFKGAEGVKNILDDELESGKTIHAIQSPQNVEAVSGSYLKISREKRWRKGIKMRIIYDESNLEYAKNASKYPLTDVRISDISLGPVTIDIYGNRTVLIFGEEPAIIRVENSEVSNAFLKLFEAINKRTYKVK